MAKIKFGAYDFEGPYPNSRHLFDKPAVYAVLCNDTKEPSRFYLIDIGVSDKPRSDIENSSRKICWMKSCHGVGTLAVAVYYAEKMTLQERQKIEKELRAAYQVPCG